MNEVLAKLQEEQNRAEAELWQEVRNEKEKNEESSARTENNDEDLSPGEGARDGWSARRCLREHRSGQAAAMPQIRRIGERPPQLPLRAATPIASSRP